MPWRQDPDPYAILVSEFMLQQTRVETVEPYFVRWMQRFPDVETLAAADLDDVLRHWAGLGYYARARNLHQTAREISERYGGRVPEGVESLRTLPGVGPYTAGAVASIAFSQPVPAVDGNARRVFARLMDHPAPTPRELHRWVEALVDPVDPGAFNQAIMELGATLCLPRNPRCKACPVPDHCAARVAGTQDERPAPRPRPDPPHFREAVAVLTREGPGRDWVLLRRRPRDGLLGGMWEFPGAEVGASQDPGAVASAVARELYGALGGDPEGVELGRPTPLEPLDHAFSHRRLRYLPFRIRLAPASLPDRTLVPVEGTGLRWVRPGEDAGLALPAAQRKLLERVH